MGAAAAAHHLACKIQGQGVVLFNGLKKFGLGPALFKTGHLFFTHDRILGQPGGHGRGKAFFKPDEVKNIADIHKPDEFILGHDFAKLAEALRLAEIVYPGCGGCGQFVHAHGAHIGFVGRVRCRLLKGLRVLGQFAQEFGIGLGAALLCRCAAMMQGQFRRKVEAVRRGLDANSFHAAILQRHYRALSLERIA